MNDRLITFTEKDGYKLAIRADRIDAVSWIPDSKTTRIYVADSDKPFEVSTDYETVLNMVWGREDEPGEN